MDFRLSELGRCESLGKKAGEGKEGGNPFLWSLCSNAEQLFLCLFLCFPARQLLALTIVREGLCKLK